jgi:hypothetical protein
MRWVVKATRRSLYLREKPGTHCTGGWGGGETGPVWAGAENVVPHRDSIPDSPVPGLVTDEVTVLMSRCNCNGLTQRLAHWNTNFLRKK